MPPTIHTYPENQGWILRLQKNREGVDLSLAYCFLLSYGRKTEKSNCIWITNVASHFQNWLFGYKSCVSFTNIHMSVTNIAFCFTKWHLGLLLSFLYLYSITYFTICQIYITYRTKYIPCFINKVCSNLLFQIASLTNGRGCCKTPQNKTQGK